MIVSAKSSRHLHLLAFLVQVYLVVQAALLTQVCHLLYPPLLHPQVCRAVLAVHPHPHHHPHHHPLPPHHRPLPHHHHPLPPPHRPLPPPHHPLPHHHHPLPHLQV